jgi:2-oxoglutarate ferredoxin oxidoreductase subunit alpha
MVEAKFMVGGEAGQGVQSIGTILARTFARGGYHVYSDQDYESRVRGGHNFFRIRIKDSEVGAINESLDFLLALNEESIDLHRKELVDGGVVIFDQEKAPGLQGKGLLGVPLSELAEREAGNKLMANTVALGACLGLIDYEPDMAEVLLKETFGSEASEDNVKALHAGHRYTRENFRDGFHINLKAGVDKGKLLLNGHEALALGAIAAGCKFMAGYPMTPASSILEYMASKAEDMDLIVVQPEDEISAVNMVVGASYAGVRAMTATSGSGFCLMVEGLGLAGLTETPVVIVDAQRPGPAVGLPTRTEQGDLQFVLYAHQGDFPRAVLAPSTVEDAFHLVVKAFNLAERYQIPVILLTDHLLATSYQTVTSLDFGKVRIDRGDLYEVKKGSKPEGYKRHKITDSGISPRAFPGLSEALVATDADEHGEEGHLIEDAGIRTSQMEKRLRKYTGLRKEIESPLTYGADKAEITLISWGSTYGAVHEAVDILRGGGMPVNMLQLNQLWPFPAEELSDALSSVRTSYVVEGNASGQLARLIRTETGIKVSGKILKYDGRPFTPAYIAERVKKGEISPW